MLLSNKQNFKEAIIMSRLDDLYKAMETLRKEGLPVNENFERKANEIEEEIIKRGIIE